MGINLQQERYIENKTIKRIVTLIKAVEKEKRENFPFWWSLWGLTGKHLSPQIVQAVNRHMLLCIRFGFSEITKYIGNPDYIPKLNQKLKEFAEKYPHRAQLLAELIDEIQLMLYNVGLYQVPPGVIDFEEPEEGYVAVGDTGVDEESVEEVPSEEEEGEVEAKEG